MVNILSIILICFAGETWTIWLVLGGLIHKTCMRKKYLCIISFRSQEIWYSLVPPQFTGFRHWWVNMSCKFLLCSLSKCLKFISLLFSFDLIKLFSWFEHGVAPNSLLCADGAVKNLLTHLSKCLDVCISFHVSDHVVMTVWGLLVLQCWDICSVSM